MQRVIAGLCLLLAGSVCLAQNKRKQSPQTTPPNLTGTWLLDESKSKMSPKLTDYTLVIEHREPEIRMSKKYMLGKKEIRQETVYYTDGRPEIDSQRRTSFPEPEVRWRGQTLVRRSISKNWGSSLEIETVSYDEWSLSPDNQTLTRTSTTTGTGFKLETKAVFRRAQ